MPAERQTLISLLDRESIPAGSSDGDFERVLTTVDALVIIMTPDYYASPEFHNIVSHIARRRCAANDGLIVGIFPVPFDARGELDWLPAAPEYSKATGRPRPARPEAIVADGAQDFLVRLDLHDGDRGISLNENGEAREMALQLRRAYRIAELRRRDPRTVADIDALHAALRQNGEAMGGDFVGSGRFHLERRHRHHGPIEEWAAFDRRRKTCVRAFILPACSIADAGVGDAELDRFAAATSMFFQADPSSLIEPLRREPGLGWFFVVEAAP